MQPDGCLLDGHRREQGHARHQAPGADRGTTGAGLPRPDHEGRLRPLVDPGRRRGGHRRQTGVLLRRARAGPRRRGHRADPQQPRRAALHRGPRGMGGHRPELPAQPRRRRRHRGAFLSRGLEGAGRVHVPLQHEVGVPPAQPQERPGGPAVLPVPPRPGHLAPGGESPLDDVFRALADPGRRRLLDSLNERNGQTLRELTECLDMARQSVSKHLAILEEANLVTTVRRGREKYHYLNAAPISEIAQRWIGQYHQQRVDALSDLKHALEDTAMDKPEFVYTTYIRTTPKQLWQALTEPAFTTRYWGGMALESDWQTGSVFTVTLADGTRIADPAQVVVEADPYRRLAYTWHTFTPEWAAHYNFSEEDRRSEEHTSE